MEEDVEWAQAVERDEVKGAKDADAWAVPRLLDPTGTAFARSVGRRNHTNAACHASSANARSAEPP
jgi:hypothetical protein